MQDKTIIVLVGMCLCSSIMMMLVGVIASMVQ